MTLTTNTGDDMMDELGLLLARYADTALRPDRAAMDRIRENLRAQAQRASVHRRAEALATAAAPTAPTAAARRPTRSWAARKVGLALAASLMLGLALGTTAFAASRAGGPFYGARVALETLTLPADPEERLVAELERLTWRLIEAQDAAARGDPNAVEAALAAYAAIISEAGVITAEDGVSQHAIDQIAHHGAILEKLLTQVPVHAQDKVREAQDKSDNAVKDLRTPKLNQGNDPGQGPRKTPPPKPTPGNDQGGNGGGGNQGGGGNEGGGGSGGNEGGGGSDGNQGRGGSHGNQGGGGSGGGPVGTNGQGAIDRTSKPDKPKAP